MKLLRYKSFAKINLFLEIFGKRQDGYHDLRSIFQTIEMHDALFFTEIPEGIKLKVYGNEKEMPPVESNIVYKTAELLKKDFGIEKGVQVELEKNIPVGSGLGGGSSNSLTTIKALNELWGIGLNREGILNYASVMGSDVPFFYYGGTVFVEGRGEVLSPVSDIKEQTVIIAKPPFSIRSSEAYKWWDESFFGEGKSPEASSFLKIDLSFPENMDLEKVLFNDFEKILMNKYPDLKLIKEALINAGCCGALLSGSGSCVFGLVGDPKRSDDVYSEAMKLTGCMVYKTRTTGRSKIV